MEEFEKPSKVQKMEKLQGEKTQNRVIKPPAENQCHLFLTQKQRYCKFPQAVGSKYCVVHSNELTGETSVRKRIPCPLDPNHSIYEDQLEKHLKKCSKQSQNIFQKLQPCFVPSVNLDVNAASSTLWDAEFEIEVPVLDSSKFKNAVSKKKVEGDLNLKQKQGDVSIKPFEKDAVEDEEDIVMKSEENEHEVSATQMEYVNKIDLDLWAPLVFAGFDEAVDFHHRDLQSEMLTKVRTKLASGTHFIAAPSRPTDSVTTEKEGMIGASPAKAVTTVEEDGEWNMILDAVLKTIGESENEKTKHHVQNRLLLDLFNRYGILEGMWDFSHENPLIPVFLEYGCGRAALSRWLVLAYQQRNQQLKKSLEDSVLENTSRLENPSTKHSTPSFFLVEREARRNKGENKKDVTEGETVVRLRLDLTDFSLSNLLGVPGSGSEIKTEDWNNKTLLKSQKITLMQTWKKTLNIKRQWKNVCLGLANDNKPVDDNHCDPVNDEKKVGDDHCQSVGDNKLMKPAFVPIIHAKHLCGGATDLALKSLEGMSCNMAVKPRIAINTCCHHRCDMTTYVGVQFLFWVLNRVEQRNPVARNQGARQSNKNRSNKDRELVCEAREGHVRKKVSVREFFSTLVASTSWAVAAEPKSLKEAFGIRSKRILDLGRAWYCRQELRLEKSEVLSVCPRTVSPENGCILAM